MELKRRKAIKYGLLAGMIIAAMCSFPLAISLLSVAVIPSDYYNGSTYTLISGFTMLLGNLALTCAPLSLPVAAVTGIATLHSARAAIASLNDAATVDLVASLLMALTGAFGTFLVIGASVYVSNGLESSIALFLLFGAPAFALVLFTLSFFGGLIYSVYVLKLKYVQQSPGH